MKDNKKYFYNIYWSSKQRTFLVGELSYENRVWTYRYSNNVIKAIKEGYQPFLELPEIDKVYHNKTIFKTFKDRIVNQIEPAEYETDNILVKKREKKLNDTKAS